MQEYKGGSVEHTPNHAPSSSPRAKKARLSKAAALSGSTDEGVGNNRYEGALMTAAPLFSLDADIKEGEEEEGEDEEAGVFSEVILEEEEEVEFDETQIQGALTEELRRLQDQNRSLQQELEELERSVVHLSHAKVSLEAQLEEVMQVSG